MSSKLSYPLATVLLLSFAGSASASPLRAGADTQVPTVSIVSPAAGTTVGGTLTVSGSASDNVLLSKVELKVDSGSYLPATGTTSWSRSIDTRAYANGSHTLLARATDSSGNQAWASRTVTISNSAGTTRIYWGAWIGKQFTGTGAPADMNAATAFESMTGKGVSLIGLYSTFMNCYVSPCTYYAFPNAAMSAIRSHGSIPFLDWSSASSPVSKTQPNFQLRDVTAGTYDSYITSFATAAKSWGHPFFLALDAEMNGSWSPWGVLTNGNYASDFVPAWKHVHDIFTNVGATNVTWVWCPNIEYTGSYKPLSSLYPGDAYVDWTCFDGYNWGTNPWKPNYWATFSQTFSPTYSLITGTIAPSKPMIIGEFASTEYGGSKAAWITDTLQTQLPKNFPKIKGFLWYEITDGNFDWPIETSSTAKSAFVTGIKSSYYAANEFGSLGGGRVTPLAP
jgi:hypothetical protein